MSARILIMAGGTGGHIFPALAVARKLKSMGHDVHWLGAKKGMESQLVSTDEFPLHLLSVSALLGGGYARKLVFPFKLVKSLLEAKRVFKQVKPNLVVGFGGYASGPGGLVAKLVGVPLVLHEQNAVPGLTNKWLSRLANTVIQAFPNTFVNRKAVATLGNPVREELIQVSTQRPVESLQHILVLGGSLGAQQLNEMIPKIMASLSEFSQVKVWHQAGKGKESQTKASYAEVTCDVRIDEFIEDMAEAYAWADLVICRSGASTVSELAVCGRPALFLPYPWHKDRQQFVNADYLASTGGAKVFEANPRLQQQMTEVVKVLLEDKLALQHMAKQSLLKGMPESVTNICDLIVSSLDVDNRNTAL